MSLKNVLNHCWDGLRVSFVAVLAAQLGLGGAFAIIAQAREKGSMRTPIKHVIVIIGENRTFDHVFVTYKPKKGESANNLLSEAIIKKTASRARILQRLNNSKLSPRSERISSSA